MPSAELAAARAELEAAAVVDATCEATAPVEILRNNANSSISADGSPDEDREVRWLQISKKNYYKYKQGILNIIYTGTPSSNVY
jgi:ACT domain-containing protein